MTNKDRQKSLDKKKWIESEKDGRDASGMMSYCDVCSKQNRECRCTATQEERESKCLCAKAYNRLQRK